MEILCNRFEGFNSEIRNFEYASILIQQDLDFAFEVLYSEQNQQGDTVGFTQLPMHPIEKNLSHEEANKNA